MAKLISIPSSNTPVTNLRALDQPSANYDQETYRVWACDNQIYGPISLATLAEWVREARVLRDTWVYFEGCQEWRLAKNIEPLRDSFAPGDETIFLERQSAEGGIAPEELRKFAILASLSNHELAQLVRFGEMVHANPGDVIIKRGDPGDALFFVLAGSVRARIFVGSEEKTLGDIPAGQFFGDMAMFTQSARSADVVCESEARLLRFGAESFR